MQKALRAQSHSMIVSVLLALMTMAMLYVSVGIEAKAETRTRGGSALGAAVNAEGRTPFEVSASREGVAAASAVAGTTVVGAGQVARWIVRTWPQVRNWVARGWNYFYPRFRNLWDTIRRRAPAAFRRILDALGVYELARIIYDLFN